MPLTDSYGQGVPYPTLTDKPNIQTLGQGIVNGVVPKGVMTFASAVVRGATLVGASAPKAGMATFLKDVGRLEFYDGTTWQAVVSSKLPFANITLASGFIAAGGNSVPPRVRREGSQVYLDGRLQKTGGASIPANSNGLLLATVPAAYRPTGNFAEGAAFLSNAGTGAPVGRIEIRHDTDSAYGPGQIILFSDRASTFVGFAAQWFVN